MEKVLSKKQCESLLERISNQEWERVDLHLFRFGQFG